MTRSGLSLGELEAGMEGDDWIFGDHLRRVLNALLPDPELSAAVGEVLRQRPCPSTDSFYRLRSAGVLRGDSPAEARSRHSLKPHISEDTCPMFALSLSSRTREGSPPV
jgi:hypothetical protein